MHQMREEIQVFQLKHNQLVFSITKTMGVLIYHQSLIQKSKDEISNRHQQLEELQFSFGQSQYSPSSPIISVNFIKFVVLGLNEQAPIKDMGIAHGDPTHQSTKQYVC